MKNFFRIALGRHNGYLMLTAYHENGDETYYFPDNLKEAFKLADNLAAKALFDSDTCF